MFVSKCLYILYPLFVLFCIEKLIKFLATINFINFKAFEMKKFHLYVLLGNVLYTHSSDANRSVFELSSYRIEFFAAIQNLL